MSIVWPWFLPAVCWGGLIASPLPAHLAGRCRGSQSQHDRVRLSFWNLQEGTVLGSLLKLKREVTVRFIWVWECVGYEM